MERPKSITHLCREQLEDLCLKVMGIEHRKTKMINRLENIRDKAIEYIESNSAYDDNIDDCWVTTNKLLDILENGVDIAEELGLEDFYE